MEVNLNSFSYSPNFGAKSKEVKKADDICRAATAEFPMMSDTKVNMLYTSYKPSSSNYERTCEIKYNLSRKIDKMRYNSDEQCIKLGFEDRIDSLTDFPLLCKLDAIKKDKVGNCSETATAALAALYANGYYNAGLAYPEFQIDIVDKKTGEVVSEGTTADIDHVFVLADMKNNGKRDVIIDPWLGFADYKSKVSDKYFSLMTDYDIELTELIAKRFFSGGNINDFDNNRYSLKKRIVVREYPTEDEAAKRQSKDMILAMFPNLELNYRMANMPGRRLRWK